MYQKKYLYSLQIIEIDENCLILLNEKKQF
jgi:hypothetical protein